MARVVFKRLRRITATECAVGGVLVEAQACPDPVAQGRVVGQALDRRLLGVCHQKRLDVLGHRKARWKR